MDRWCLLLGLFDLASAVVTGAACRQQWAEATPLDALRRTCLPQKSIRPQIWGHTAKPQTERRPMTLIGSGAMDGVFGSRQAAGGVLAAYRVRGRWRTRRAAGTDSVLATRTSPRSRGGRTFSSGVQRAAGHTGKSRMRQVRKEGRRPDFAGLADLLDDDCPTCSRVSARARLPIGGGTAGGRRVMVRRSSPCLASLVVIECSSRALALGGSRLIFGI